MATIFVQYLHFFGVSPKAAKTLSFVRFPQNNNTIAVFYKSSLGCKKDDNSKVNVHFDVEKPHGSPAHYNKEHHDTR